MKLIKRRDVLKKKLGDISDSTYSRRIKTHPLCPKPFPQFPGIEVYDESEWDEFIDILKKERETAA